MTFNSTQDGCVVTSVDETTDQPVAEPKVVIWVLREHPFFWQFVNDAHGTAD